MRIALIGDVVVDDEMARALRPSNGARQFWGVVRDADVVVFNLEGPITGATNARREKLITLRSSRDILELLDRHMIACLANNHIMDFGEDGLLDTLRALDDRQVAVAGAGRNLRRASRPAVMSLPPGRLAVLCMADPRYDPATDTTSGTSRADEEALREAVREARADCTWLVVVLHMGMEFAHLPTPYMLRCAEVCAQEGAEVVQFHHAHCVSGVSRIGATLVLWGTGNYAFARGSGPGLRRWSEGAAWVVDLATQRRAAPSLTIRPLLLDEHGVPGVAPAGRADRILEQIGHLSKQIERRRFLGARRIVSILDYQFLRAALANYVAMLRRSGVRTVAGAMWGTLRTQFGWQRY